MQIRFHLDEGVHGAVADALRRREIDVTRAGDVDLLGASDREHLAFAHRDHRVLVTHDSDFLRIHSRGVKHGGIAFAQNQLRSTGEIVRALTSLWLTASAEEMAGCVIFL